MIKTICRDCKFAEFKENKQIGCKYNRLEKFKQLDIPVEEITENGKTYYLIEDICNYCFKAESYNKTEQVETKFYNMTRFQTDFIVVDNKNQEYCTTYNNLLASIHSAIYEQIRPESFIFVITNNDKLTAEQKYNLIELTNDMLKGTGIICSVSFMVEKECDFWECVQSVLHKSTSKYYTIFSSGYNTTYDFNYKLNKELNENLRTFAMFVGFDEYNGLTFNSNVSKELNGFIDGHLKNKVLKNVGWMSPKVKYRFIIESLNDELPS